jgi:hypothetical protein
MVKMLQTDDLKIVCIQLFEVVVESDRRANQMPGVERTHAKNLGTAQTCCELYILKNVSANPPFSQWVP